MADAKMNYKDTLLDLKNFKWRPPKFKEAKDGKIDLTLKLPLTNLLLAQAYKSFLLGIQAYHSWITTTQFDDKMTPEEMHLKLEEQWQEWSKR